MLLYIYGSRRNLLLLNNKTKSIFILIVKNNILCETCIKRKKNQRKSQFLTILSYEPGARVHKQKVDTHLPIDASILLIDPEYTNSPSRLKHSLSTGLEAARGTIFIQKFFLRVLPKCSFSINWVVYLIDSYSFIINYNY